MARFCLLVVYRMAQKKTQPHTSTCQMPMLLICVHHSLPYIMDLCLSPCLYGIHSAEIQHTSSIFAAYIQHNCSITAVYTCGSRYAAYLQHIFSIGLFRIYSADMQHIYSIYSAVPNISAYLQHTKQNNCSIEVMD